MQNTAHLAVRNVNKQYPGVKALNDVSLEAYPGEACGLIGINGAGKSTMMNVLAGEVRADSGTFFIDGREIRLENQTDAVNNGISLIHQEAMVFPTLSVAENIFIRNKKQFMKHGLMDYGRMYAEAARYLESLGSDLNPKLPVQEVTAGGRQMIEIARALAVNADILLFDEPTSSLSIKEKRKLFDIIARLKQQGKTIIYITHFIHEVKQICERVVVMRDGCVTGKNLISDVQIKDMITMMIGADVQMPQNKNCSITDEVVLQVEDVSHSVKVHDVSFKVYKGEVLGVWGLLTSGRTEIFETVLGLLKRTKGQVLYREADGRMKKMRNIQLLRRVGYVTENRHFDGLFKSLPLWKNVTMPDLKHYGRVFPNTGRERAATLEIIEQLSIKTPDEDFIVENLSGGNQQKVLLGRWMAKKPTMYFLDEPTRGVDVNAKSAIHRTICDLAAEGNSVIMISSEIDEILSLCDRALIVRDGTVVSELDKSAMTRQNLMELCVGEAEEEVSEW